jgi:hypothetical protein
MTYHVDTFLKAMTNKDPSAVPLSPRYRATENAIPSALSMMTIFRLDTEVNQVGLVVDDPVLGNVVAFASVTIGGLPATFWVRLHTADGIVDEVEVYHTKSRGEAGYVLSPDAIDAEWPREWTEPVDPSRLPSRAELEHLGRAIYDRSMEGPESAEACVLMEQGGIVHELVDFMELMFDTPPGDHEPEATKEMYGVGLDPFRPDGLDAQVWAINEAAGIVAVVGTVHGYVLPTVTRSANLSAFVPESMLEMHARSIKPEWIAGRNVLTTELPVTSFNAQIWRMYDGKVQGLQMYNFLTGSGAKYPWAHRGAALA